MSSDEHIRRAVDALVGRERSLDVKMPSAKPVAPRTAAEARALAEVYRCMTALQSAIENYQAVLGVWMGRPRIAVGFDTDPDLGRPRSTPAK